MSMLIDNICFKYCCIAAIDLQICWIQLFDSLFFDFGLLQLNKTTDMPLIKILKNFTCIT